MKQLTWNELSAQYCERQEQTPDGLYDVLFVQAVRFDCVGWMLLECQMMDSSRLGSLTILPYGPNNTYKEATTAPISPRGLASDMSICIGYMLAADLKK